MIGDVLWSLLWIAVGLVISPLVFPLIDRGMRWLKARRR
jgi:hypothetical protein